MYASVCAVALGGVPSQAATLYWDADGSPVGNNVEGTNLGGTGNWSGVNWWDTTNLVSWPNTNIDHAIFSGPYPTSGIPVSRTVTLDTGTIANRLSFYRSGYTLSGGTLTLAGTTPTIFTALGETATIDSQLLGTDGLTIAGGGTLRLGNATNAFSGPITVNYGILSIKNAAALGADTSTIVVNGTATRGFGGGAMLLAGGYSSGVNLTRTLSLQGQGPIVLVCRIAERRKQQRGVADQRARHGEHDRQLGRRHVDDRRPCAGRHRRNYVYDVRQHKLFGTWQLRDHRRNQRHRKH
ncbi:MAG: hypothetical protein QM775_16810 [Pirellulales bacterium]